MADSVLVIGRAGSGKSTAIETLDPKTTFIVNVANKALPFQGWKRLYKPFNSKDKTGNMAKTPEAKHILQVMDIVDREMPEIKCLIIDDWQYMSAFDYMNRVDEVGYQKFNIFAKNMYLLGTKPKDMRDDLIVFFLTHEEESSEESGEIRIKAKTVGKLVDQLITLEGLFTVVLHATTKKTKEGVVYYFETQTDSRTTAKSPRGMFKDLTIPNDLEFVRKSIVSYNELNIQD
jgi:hypothetical protein